MNILIIGATSAIAQEVARIYAENGNTLYLIGRNEERLNIISNDLKVRGACCVFYKAMDFSDYGEYDSIISEVFNVLIDVDVAMIAHGVLPDQIKCQKSIHESMAVIDTNIVTFISFLICLSNKFEAQKSGVIAVITSVAGDRGRQSNYLYGATKSMLSTYLQGMRNRLFKYNINVIDVRPGFVDTPMTADYEKGVLWAKPETVAKHIVQGIDDKKYVLYVPFFWKFIMMIIKSIPEVIFKRLRL